MPALSSLSVAANVAVIGASGGIGAEFVRQLSAVRHIAQVHAFSRAETDFADDKVLSHTIEITKDDSIRLAALAASAEAPLDAVIVTTGVLHCRHAWAAFPTIALGARPLTVRRKQH